MIVDYNRVRHTVRILHGPSRALAQTVYYRADLHSKLLTRWEWYFKYREALLRVQNPRWYTSLETHRYELDPRSAEEMALEQAKKKLSSARAQATKVQNALELYVREYNEIFPIEDDPIYKRIMDKLTASMCELERAEDNFSKINQ